MVSACSFHGLGSRVCSESELTSKTLNALRQFSRALQTGEPPIERPLQKAAENRETRTNTPMPRTEFKTMIPVFETWKATSF